MEFGIGIQEEREGEYTKAGIHIILRRYEFVTSECTVRKLDGHLRSDH